MKRKVFLLILSALIISGCGRRGTEESVQVIVKPNFFQLPVGGEVQFSAEVSGTLDKAVQWEVKGAGSSISPSGLYKAPLTVTTQPATIQAKSVADPAAVGNAAVETTAIRQWEGEGGPLQPDMDKLVVGGYTIRPGQTIDLNGDNVLDLVTFSGNANTVTFFLGLGLGDARFNSHTITIAAPVAVAVADFIPESTEEFAADVAIACPDRCEPGKPNLALVQGRIQENFAISPYPLGLDLSDLSDLFPEKAPILLLAGRFHGDVGTQNSDLIAGTEDGTLFLFLQNRQTGNFTRKELGMFGLLSQVITADFNQDTFLDLAIVRQSVGEVLILLGDGSGAFPTPKTVSMPQPTSIAVGDFNADGIPDLVASFSVLKSLSISIGNGDGTFQQPTSIALPSEPGSILVEDLNLDRIVGTPQIKANPRHDIAVSLPNNEEIYVLFGNGEGDMIGNWVFKTGVVPTSLLAGFFSGPQSPRGFQTVGLMYINKSVNRFFLVNNTNS